LQALLDGLSRWPFALIFFGEFPISAIAFWSDVRFGKEFSVRSGFLGSSWNALVVLPGSIDGTTAGGA
jgi:hypothetical protein